jgi:hypothetical protein
MSNKKYTVTFTPKEWDSVIEAVAYYEVELQQNYDDGAVPEGHPFMRACRKLAAARRG